MAQSKRIETLCALLQKARVFADIGCDHGYCTEYMLKNNLCERAIFSDISKGSLLKAKKLLGGYEKAGKATPVLGRGGGNGCHTSCLCYDTQPARRLYRQTN